MADILPFRKPRPGEKHKGKTLCRHGFHKWEISKNKQFDTRMGKLVTLFTCKRCGATKVESL